MKIIDSFVFYNELDMLNLRLHELNDVVDFFILAKWIPLIKSISISFMAIL